MFRHGFNRLAKGFLSVVGVLLKRGHNLRKRDRFVIGMPAIVIRNHCNRSVTKLRFARELGFGHVRHANDVEFHFAVHVSFRERGELRSLHTDVCALAMDLYPAMNTGISKNARDLAACWLVESHVSDKSIAEESRDSPFRAVYELICDKEFSGAQIFFER